jgi:hypothetical protein
MGISMQWIVECRAAVIAALIGKKMHCSTCRGPE